MAKSVNICFIISLDTMAVYLYTIGGGGGGDLFQLEFYTKITTAVQLHLYRAIVFWNFPREIVCIIYKSHDCH